ncbi:MAG: ATP-binding protein, partial [Myxococcota bacterium]
PPDRLDAVFESFIQADPAVRRKHGGSGLGLAIVKGIVEAMGGQIRVSSDLGVGSTFSFTVPLPRARGPLRPPEG